MQPRGWKPLLICPNAPLALRVRATLNELGLEDIHYLSQYPRTGAIAGVVAQHGSNVCFLELASHAEQALGLIPEAAATLPVVVLNPQKDADLILRCLRLGACEFLSDPSLEQVRDVLERLERQHSPAEPQRNSVAYCVIPGKPGSGASTIATYLAIEMKRAGVSKVLLVDTDPVSGSIAFLLKLKPAFHLGDAIRDWSRMELDLWARLALPCQGIDILPAPENPATRLEIDPRAAVGLLAFWRKHYDAILLDVPWAHAGGSEFAPLADSVLVVTTNELGALHATRRSLECLGGGMVDPARIKLVVNRYGLAFGLKREAVETALKMEPYALLRNDWDAVQTALLEGKPLPPGSPLAVGVRTLGERLLGKEKTIKKRAAFFGLLPARG